MIPECDLFMEEVRDEIKLNAPEIFGEIVILMDSVYPDPISLGISDLPLYKTLTEETQNGKR